MTFRIALCIHNQRENQRAQSTSLLPIQSHPSGPSALNQSGVLSPKPGPDCPTAAGAASLGQAEKQNPSPFRKLRALADVCSARWIELDHGYARKEDEAGPLKNRASQRRCRERKNAAVDGIEQVRARNRQRYYDRIDRLKATRQYEAFKCQKGLRRYHTMPEEQRNEMRRKIYQTGRIRTPSTMAMVGRATGPSLSSAVVAAGLGGVRACVRRTLCKPFVSTRWRKWTSICKEKSIKHVYITTFLFIAVLNIRDFF